VLFFAESVTLAHLARPLALAGGLDKNAFEPIVATGTEYCALAAQEGIVFRHLTTIPSEKFRDSLAKGRPVYSFPVLRDYLDEDRRHLEAVRPDVVVGDFRLSLSVSARLARIPYIALSNAYWSPYAKLRMPLPEHPINKILGVAFASMLFRITRPAIFAYHSLPMNRLRVSHGLPPLGPDLRRTYTDADYTLYADVPDLIPMRRLPANHGFLGPVNWSPRTPNPTWWETLSDRHPVIYVTLGSSGQVALLPIVIEALESLPVTAILATAGRADPSKVPSNIFVSDYLPGIEAAKRASLVICNGGSPATYQALCEGKPVIGIASNMDQYLSMSLVERAGAGKLLRSGELSAGGLRAAVEIVLRDTKMTDAAQGVREMCAKFSAGRTIETWLRNAVSRYDEQHIRH